VSSPKPNVPSEGLLLFVPTKNVIPETLTLIRRPKPHLASKQSIAAN
jgi:hypothetical protein